MFSVFGAIQVAGFVTAAAFIQRSDGRQSERTGAPTSAPYRAKDASTLGASGSGELQSDVVATIQARLQAPAHGGGVAVTITSLEDHLEEMDRSGISPVPFGALDVAGTAGAVVGTQNAFMSIAPDLANPSINSAIVTILTGFIPGEPIRYFISGSLATTGAADEKGRFAARISTGAAQGFTTFEGVGQSSGRRAGGVAGVLSTATPVPGVAIGPHAINPNGSGAIYMGGTRYPASTSVTIARNGVALGTTMSDSDGAFLISVPVTAGADASAIYSANTAAAGSLNGQSIEERADAGTPPQGDQNLSRAYFDRAVLPSTGATLGWVGEGFQPGETVNISGCSTGSATADSHGAVFLFVNFGGGPGVAQCVYTGVISGRVARSTAQGDPNAINVPAAINAPATLPKGAGFVFLFDRLTPSQSGTVNIDGVSQGPATTNASGYGSVALTAPNVAGIHSVVFVGSSGEAALAPLYVNEAGSTPTPTPTIPSRVTPTRIPTVRRAPRVIPFR